MHSYWLVTVVFGIVASLIAGSKGRNTLGWLVAGMFLGPFSLIVSVLPPVERSGLYFRCPACREVIHEGAQTCRFCHSGDASRDERSC